MCVLCALTHLSANGDIQVKDKNIASSKSKSFGFNIKISILLFRFFYYRELKKKRYGITLFGIFTTEVWCDQYLWIYQVFHIVWIYSYHWSQYIHITVEFISNFKVCHTAISSWLALSWFPTWSTCWMKDKVNDKALFAEKPLPT